VHPGLELVGAACRGLRIGVFGDIDASPATVRLEGDEEETNRASGAKAHHA
jgi:hypothetical protein